MPVDSGPASTQALVDQPFALMALAGQTPHRVAPAPAHQAALHTIQPLDVMVCT